MLRPGFPQTFIPQQAQVYLVRVFLGVSCVEIVSPSSVMMFNSSSTFRCQLSISAISEGLFSIALRGGKRSAHDIRNSLENKRSQAARKRPPSIG